jgi:hypothetical protein
MPKWKTFAVNGFRYDPNKWTIERDGDAVLIGQDIGGGRAKLIDDPAYVEGQSDEEIINAAIFECFPDAGSRN